jgi:hypothetical protein
MCGLILHRKPCTAKAESGDPRHRRWCAIADRHTGVPRRVSRIYLGQRRVREFKCQRHRAPVVLQTSPPHPKSTRSMRMGGTPHGTIQVRRRGLVVARCGIGAADSFGMKQCPGGCPISGIAVLVDRQGLHDRWRRMPTTWRVLGTGRGTGVRGQVGRASTICIDVDVSITRARSKPAPSNRLRN